MANTRYFHPQELRTHDHKGKVRNAVVFGTVNRRSKDHLPAIQHPEQFMALFPEGVRGPVTRRVRLDEAPGCCLKTAQSGTVLQMSRAA